MIESKIDISIVSPVYMAWDCIDELVQQTIIACEGISVNYEIILVDDASPDNSWAKIKVLCSKYSQVKGIRLSRNFGQHNAITAGLKYSSGDYVIVMDCDLQDDPSEIPKLYTEVQNGYDGVWAIRNNRRDTFIKILSSLFFYKCFNWLTGANYDPRIANYGIFSKQIIKATLSLNEQMRGYPFIINWVGFNVVKIEVNHSSSYRNESSYSFMKLINFALGLMFAYSNKPLKMTVLLGLVISFSSILFAFYNIYLMYSGQIVIPGYTSLIVSMWLLSGLIIFSLGIVGLYVGKVFEGVKNRPLYIVKTLLN